MAVPTPAGFTLKPVVNRTSGGIGKTIGLVLHVQAGNGGLSGWFNNPKAQASSTWWAGKKGEREQYGNPDTDKFWAQAAGNTTYHSIETEGQPSEPLTAEQIETVAQAFAWGHTRYGWPLVLAEQPGDPGLGWHGMGGTAWGGHTGCPGDIRKTQRPLILARAQEIAQGDDVTPDQITAAVIAALKTDGLVASPAKSNPTVAPVTGIANAGAWALQARDAVARLADQVTALDAKVSAIAPAQPSVISDEQLERALRKVIGSVDNTPSA